MAAPKLSDEALDEALRLVAEHGNVAFAAKAVGIAYTTLENRYKKALARDAIDPAIRDSMAAVNTEMVPQLAWLKTKSEDGTSFSVLLKPEKDNGPDFLARVAIAFADIPAAPAIIQSEKSAEGKIGFFPQSDIHMGIDITADRGGADYTPEIALERMKDGFAQAHAAIPARETAVILDNGDLTHANDDRDVTVKSEHRLKVKGSHRRNLSLCIIGKAWQIDMALQTSARVIYRSNKGNHDPNTPDTIIEALKQRYRNEPRVTIDDSERELWVWQRGKVFLSAHHGHGIKPEKLAANIPAHFPDEFGLSRFWYLFTGHLHNPRQDTFGAFNWFQLPALCSLDQNSADMGYTDNAAMRAMLFCERGGLKNDMTIRF